MLMAMLMTGKQGCVKRTHVASGDGVGEGNSIVSFISLFCWHFWETGGWTSHHHLQSVLFNKVWFFCTVTMHHFLASLPGRMNERLFEGVTSIIPAIRRSEAGKLPWV